MLKEYTAILRRFLIGSDWIIIVAAFAVCYYLRGYLPGEDLPFAQYLWVLGFVSLAWVGLMYYFGMYRSFRTKDVSEVLYVIFKAGFFTLLPLSGLIYFSREVHVSRAFISLYFITGTFLLSLEKLVVIALFRQVRRKGYNYRNIIIVGTNARALELLSLVRTHGEWGFRVLGFVDEDVSRVGSQIAGVGVIGSFNDIPRLLQENVVDEVLFVVPRSWLDRIEGLILYCETQGVRASLAVNFFDLRIARARQTDLHGFPLLTFESAPSKVWQLLIKRGIDIAGALLGLAVLIPFGVLTAVLVKLTSPGPVFFRQTRSGLNGRTFTLLKYRTMYRDAEARLKELKDKNEMQGPVFKMENDPRVTPLGRLLRKFSIDEFPQLWNVLVGDMSLVGPRPPIPSEVDQYDPWHRRRLSMRPGITCIWQVRGRNKITDFDEWMRLDLEYIDTWSLWLDIEILMKTIPVVVFGVGAK
jgi:exopolysaccharide biosynthesis polyprenyl glycosylphosphotransferase